MLILSLYFFFNDTATTEIYTLSLHDALPISTSCGTTTSCGAARMNGGIWASCRSGTCGRCATRSCRRGPRTRAARRRSEEHTSELQSPCNFVCRLLLEKKKKTKTYNKCSTYP